MNVCVLVQQEFSNRKTLGSTQQFSCHFISDQGIGPFALHFGHAAGHLADQLVHAGGDPD